MSPEVPPSPPPPPDPAVLRRAAARRALALDDDALLGECEVDVFIASGPGGQHRNKTESGVRLRHAPTELLVTATERRSQPMNKQVALERLREKLKALTFVPKKRRPTKPSKAAKKKRVEGKRRRSETKKLRGRPQD